MPLLELLLGGRLARVIKASKMLHHRILSRFTRAKLGASTRRAAFTSLSVTSSTSSSLLNYATNNHCLNRGEASRRGAGSPLEAISLHIRCSGLEFNRSALFFFIISISILDPSYFVSA